MKKTLYVDAGHGGIDSSGKYTTPSTKGKFFDHKDAGKFHNGGMFYEGVWNRSFAAKFIEIATEAGFHCVPVYDPIQDVSLGKRVETANNYWQEVSGRTGVYLSFHSNAFKSTNRGFHLFHHPYSQASKALAEELVDNINQVFTNAGSISTKPLREGWLDLPKKQIYYVLEATSMRSLLFEFGYFDNIDDAKMIYDPSFQLKLAAELVKSLSTSKLL